MENYSFLQGSLLINGVEITGYAEGDDLINATRRVDSFSDVVGGDGQMAVSLNADRSGVITFRLLQTSKSNAYLSGLIAAAETGINVVVTAQYVGIGNADVAAGSLGYIVRPADMTRGTAINMQEWSVVVENLAMFSGPSE